ncbi:unnamed protein product [Phytomonas sp. EM1]|nr:unnamed protein product [Phytomonas sp. EM1]|eukprot:CCW63558.1 unnamed protein product [Phytomonas sp. isolate EM1]
MSANAEEREVANDVLTRRARRRKEIVRYHQRQHNKVLKSDANLRDNRLFLFSEGTKVSWETTTVPPRDLNPVSLLAPSSQGNPAVKDEALEDWNFEFVFHSENASRKPSNRLDGDEDDGLEGGVCTHEKAIISPTFFSEVADSEVTSRSESLMLANTQGVKRQAKPLSMLLVPENTMAGPTGGRPPNFIYVSRAEGVPPIPVRTPMASGTDLNVPTSNYLTLDSVYNIHQHAPGFVKNERAALGSMFSRSMLGWEDLQEDVLILSTGNAMRLVFEQAFTDDKPIALQVQRLGPTLTVGIHTDAPSSVREMRKRALLSKALYRLSEAAPPPDSRDAKVTEEVVKTSEPPAAPTNAVALPPQRIGLSVAEHAQVHNRYSHTLRWGIDKMEVLVGVDTPIVLDRRSNTEQMLKLEDTSDVMTPQEMQRDLLNCWFDATLANVPQVGIYIHNAGVVQCFEVKKVQELLGLVEGRVATAAMNFTSNVLRWLVQQCVKDGATYAVLRGYRSSYLELYELPREHTLFTDPTYNDTHVSPEAMDAAARQCREDHDRLNLNLARMCLGMAQHLFHHENIAKTFDTLSLLLRSFVIFLQQGDPAYAVEHVSEIAQMLPKLIDRLILQRHAASLPSMDSKPAKNHDVKHTKEDAVGNEKQSIQEVPSGGVVSETKPRLFTEGGNNACRALPEAYREALVTGARFEMRLRQTLEDSTLKPILRRGYTRSLVLCSVAIGVAVARTLDAFSAERSAHFRGNHSSHKHGSNENAKQWSTKKPTVPADAEKKKNMTLEKDEKDFTVLKNLLQVIVEGLMRLEHLSNTIGAFATSIKQSETSDHGSPNVTPEVSTDVQNANQEAGKETHKKRSPPSQRECGLLIDPRADVDVEPLNRFLCEIYGDVILIIMADSANAFTVDVLTEVARRISSREEEKAQQQQPSQQSSPGSKGSLPSSSCSTLQWISALTTDPVSLSFTAMRFYAKAGNETRSLLIKMAKVYYYVGVHYLNTDRYTKALEALYRAKSLFKASEKASEDSPLAEYFTLAPMVFLEDVLKALGDVYTNMALLKMRAALPITSVEITPTQPLSIGLLHHGNEEETRFFQKAIDTYTEGACWVEKAQVLLRYAATFIDNATLSGRPMDRAASARTFELLVEARKAAEKSRAEGTDWRRRLEWETLRLVTTTAVGQCGSPLLRSARTIAQHWAERLCREAVLEEDEKEEDKSDAVTDLRVTVKPPLEAATAGEQNLQLGLVYVVDVEGRCAAPGVAASTRKAGLSALGLRETTRQCVAFGVAAMREVQARWQAHAAAAKSTPSTSPTPMASSRRMSFIAHSWKVENEVEWVYRMTSMMVLRALKALMGCSEKKLKSEAATFFSRVLALVNSVTKVEDNKASDSKHKRWMDAIKSLLFALEPILVW